MIFFGKPVSTPDQVRGRFFSDHAPGNRRAGRSVRRRLTMRAIACNYRIRSRERDDNALETLRNPIDYSAWADVTWQPTIRRSAGDAIIIQKIPLGLRRASAKHAIAMREPPEFFDDIPMFPRVAQLLRIIERFVQSHAAILIGQRLGMHERQIEERPHRRNRSLDQNRAQVRHRPQRRPWHPSRRRARRRETCCAETGRAEAQAQVRPPGFPAKPRAGRPPRPRTPQRISIE